MSLVEFGQEVSGTWFLGLGKIAHYVSSLLPNMDCFLKFHFTLGMRQDKHKNKSLLLQVTEEMINHGTVTGEIKDK